MNTVSAEKARAVKIEDELARRGLPYWTTPRRNNLGQPCPMCGGLDRFSVSTKKQVFFCRGCAKSGDVIDLVQFLDGVNFLDAVKTLAGDDQIRKEIKTPSPAAKCESEEAERRRKINVARSIWNGRRPIFGTIAEPYLRLRGLDVDQDHLHYMGFDQAAGWKEDDPVSSLLRVPCLLAVYRLIDTNEIVAIQKTRLAEDSSKLGRRFNGSPKGAVIKIDSDEDVTMGLALGEGLETCLSARTLGFRPVWAAGTAGAIETFPVLNGVESLTLFREFNDDGTPNAANARAVDTCARRWIAAGKQVFFLDPPQGCGDANDVLQKGIARA